MKKDSIYSQIVGRIIRAAMQVYSCLGTGYKEAVYLKALAIEIPKTKKSDDEKELSFELDRDMPAYYSGQEVGTQRVRFLVEEEVLVELKAVPQLKDFHLAQAIKDLESLRLTVGVLLNFGGRTLQYHRLFPQIAIPTTEDLGSGKPAGQTTTRS